MTAGQANEGFLVQRPIVAPILGFLGAGVALNLGVLIPVIPLRAMIVLPIALVLPGCALLCAVFGFGRGHDRVSELALSCILSLALYPLVGMLVTRFGILLFTTSIVISTDLLVASLVLIAALRTKSRPTAAVTDPPATRPLAHGKYWRWTVALIVFLGFVAGAIGLGIHTFPTPRPEPYTQFDLTGQWSRIEGIVKAQQHARIVVSVAVSNHTGHRQTYVLAAVNNRIHPWPERTISVANGSTWRGTVEGHLTGNAHLHRINIRLSSQPGGKSLSNLVVWVRK